MGRRARLAFIVALAVALTACGGSPKPPSAAPSATPAPSSSGALPTDPCAAALTLLGAFTERLAGGLGSLRELVIAPTFDRAAAATAIRQVSATFTTYSGLGQGLQGCAAAAALVPLVDGIGSRAGGPLAESLAARIADEQTHWEAAVALVGLLPDVLQLSKQGSDAAAGLGVDVPAAGDPGAAAAGRSPPPGTAWIDFASWSVGFWPAVTGQVGKVRDAVAKGRRKAIQRESSRLEAAAATGRDWLAANTPLPCYRSTWRAAAAAADAYRDAAAAYGKQDADTGRKLVKRGDAQLAKLRSVPGDRFRVRCELDPAAPG